MKKLFALILISFSVFSCSLDDGGSPDFHFEILPIQSVEIPEQFILGQPSEITVHYLRPTGCHVFNDFYYQAEGDQRTVAVVMTVYDSVCEPDLNEEIQSSFVFKPSELTTYTFRFWLGEDEEGNDIYEIIDVEVVE